MISFTITALFMSLLALWGITYLALDFDKFVKEKEGERMTKLDSTRELDGATRQDSDGRYYWQDSNGKNYYGFNSPIAGLWICYTCGHLCECGEGE